MTTTHHPRPGQPDENLGEFAEELRLLAEALLERVEPVLRRTASDGRTEWSSCSWCPVCAAAAIVRGEHHDVVAAIAEHGTAIVTVLREALAGVPVDPVIPPDLDPESPEYQAWHRYSHGAGTGSGAGDRPFADAYANARGEHDEKDGPGEGSESTASAAESAGHHGAAANLAAVFARFVAGAQGRAAARVRAPHNDDQSDEPMGPGPGAARRPEDPDPVSGTGFRAANGADDRVGPAAQPFGPPVARPADDPGRSADAGGPAAGPSGREASAPGRAAQTGRRPTRGKYVPIDITIKA
ncbi:hypothetical protein [Nocardia sp. CA-145437]|uniref:hypothetical protein n=1 Tax=Nocardia sp. CA-145437 TaxID=3239980 RepID=UPI003D99BB3E